MLTLKPTNADAPIPFDEFMRHAARHYYAHHNPFGAAGDFVTAPDISQIFGELIGLWVAATWQTKQSPTPFTVLELGPGRGTLMADALRAIGQAMPACLSAVRLHLLESSPALRAQQTQTLAIHNPVFIDDLSTLPAQPLIVVANEFFDALPVAQYRLYQGQWKQRAVQMRADQYEWATLPINADAIPDYVRDHAPTDWMEYNADSIAIMHALARHIERYGGAMLIIDYGYAGPVVGDTVQALRHHQPHDVLQNVGDADITAHVDFTALAQAAQPLPCSFMPQGYFLHSFGGRERLAALCAHKDGPTQQELYSGYERLTAPGQMGELFKVLTVNV